MEESAFPRGGRSKNDFDRSENKTTTPKGKKRSQSSDYKKNDASTTARNDDFLFGTPKEDESAQKKRRKRTKQSSTATTDASTTDDAMNGGTQQAPLGGGSVLAPSGRKDALIEALSFNKLAKGTKLLGLIREVADEYAVVSLPNMLTGFIRRQTSHKAKTNENAPPLTKVLVPNTMMAVSVLRTTTESVAASGSHEKPKQQRRIELSVQPSHLNASIASFSQDVTVRGSIKSIEDHGILVDLGGGRTGFCKFSAIQSGYTIEADSDNDDSDDDTSSTSSEDEEDVEMKEVPKDDSKRVLNKGRVYDFIVEATPTGTTPSTGVVQLTLPTTIEMAKIVSQPGFKQHTLASLQPGMLVSSHVEALARNGLCVTFLANTFRGAIELQQVGAYWGGGEKKKDQDTDAWKTVFTGRLKQVTARVIAVDPITKIVRLSLLPHVLALSTPQTDALPSVGTIVKNAIVIRLDPGLGALLAIPESESDRTNSASEEEAIARTPSLKNLYANESYAKASKVKVAYVHISKALDPPEKSASNYRTPEALFSKHFLLHTKVESLRILSTSNFMDNIASCATAPSIVNAHVLTHADIHPGEIYKSVPVLSLLEGGGVIVNLGLGIRGLIPPNHLFDKSSSSTGDNTAGSSFRNKTRMAKYKVGNKIDVRCLNVEPAAKRCLLTAKKALLSSDTDAPITSFDQIKVGMKATGFVSRVTEKVVSVTFYNNVYGSVSSRSLAAELGVEDPRLNYMVGDVVTARVVSCVNKGDEDSDKWNLQLSLRASAGDDEDIEQVAASANDKIGTHLKSGTTFPEKSVKIVQLVSSIAKPNGSYVPGYAVVRVKAKHIAGLEATTIECKLPFDQLVDVYSSESTSAGHALDEMASKVLKVGKRINQEALVLSVPQSKDVGSPLPILSLRPLFISMLKKQGEDSKNKINVVPSLTTHLYMGAVVSGYVTRIDPRYGAFVRFLDNMTGLIPKLKNGLEVDLYSTITCKIVALDVTARPMKILLKKCGDNEMKTLEKKINQSTLKVKPGEDISEVEVVDVNFARAAVKLVGKQYEGYKNVRARIHVTMAQSKTLSLPDSKDTDDESDTKKKDGKRKKRSLSEESLEKKGLTKQHPFSSWREGTRLNNLKIVAVDTRDGVTYIELTNRTKEEEPPVFVTNVVTLVPGKPVSGIVSSVPSNNRGLWVQVCPGVTGFISALECSNSIDVLNDMRKYYPCGSRIECIVMGKDTKKKKRWGKVPRLDDDEHAKKKKETTVIELSIILREEMAKLQNEKKEKDEECKFIPLKPLRGDLVVGRVDRKSPTVRGPALMLNLRGGFHGRCCITELDNVNEWTNMPLGKIISDASAEKTAEANNSKVIVTDEEDVADTHPDDDDAASDDESDSEEGRTGDFPHGRYVQARILSGSQGNPILEISLRPSRIKDGSLKDDNCPDVKDVTHAFVVMTNRKGCFVRLSRHTEGRIILKELSNGFIPDPVTMFPPGRLVVGKVKEIKAAGSKKKGHVTTMVDLDMRESTLLQSKDRLSLEELEEQTKHKGIVTRVESYGVFVRLDNSDLSGLAHMSECSDNYIKNLGDLYDPGDLVKVLVIKVDKEQNRIGLSLKASLFEDDSDSDSDESSSDESDDDSDEDEEMADAVISESSGDSALDSDDENYVSKLAAKLEKADGDDQASDDGSDSDSSDDDSDDDEDDAKPSTSKATDSMDTDVGFEWGGDKPVTSEKPDDSDDSSSSDDDSDEDEEVDTAARSSHKSRKNAAAKRMEEKEIALRETALADGTADENPETSVDFERIITSEPNNSEHWIKFMAYHLSLADVDSARNVANRAFDRIEFRQEGEKLNVWTALLTLELKYGTSKTLHDTIDRACQHNNPKQVYLRVCEMMEKEVDAAARGGSGTSTDAETKADDMFAKMTKKFKSKKTAWLARLQYLLKGGRHEDAHKVLKRSLFSLPSYKHVETMSKFAQLEFEHGSMERGRTIFDTLLEKHPKRLDLLFVHVDKEVKNGEISAARALLERVVSGNKKMSDKQMKSLFKKWYRIEETHGTDETREHVKASAKAYVEKSTKR